jgi:CP family cyanate transporter-like MFS transporter
MPMLLQWGYHWQHALALLALPCFAALVAAWLVLHLRKQMPPTQCDVLPEVSQAPQSALQASLSPRPLKRLLARPRTWTLMAAFGIVNGGYASLVTWLAAFYQQRGWDNVSSSHLIVVMAVTQALFAIGLPALARGYTDRRPWLLLVLVMQAIGFWGFAFYPDSAPQLWSILCGAGLGGAFSLTIVTALDHLPAAKSAGALTALMQGGGFLIAAAFPLMFAQLLQWSGDFGYGWVMHLVMVLMTMVICISFNPKRYAQVMCAA